MSEKLNFENRPAEDIKEREQRSDVLLRFLRTAEDLEPLHGRNLKETFSNDQEKRAYIESLSPQEYHELLDGINGILRRKKKDEWGMDGETVALEGAFTGVGYVPPRQEDKPELLEKALEAAKEMNRDGRDLKDIAVVICSSLNAIHPYLDANGRTSRFIYTLLTEGFDETRLREVLGRHGRDKVNIDPGLIQTDIDDLIEKELGVKDFDKNTDKITNLFGRSSDLEFGPEVSEEDKKLFGILLNKDDRFMFLSVYQYLEGQEDRNKYLRKFPNRTAIPIDTLSQNLTPDGVRTILQNYRDLKKKYVSVLIDAIAHPEKEEYKIEHEGQEVSLNDFFELRMREEAEKIAEEDRLEKERQEAEELERKRIEQKENDLKERFNNGEGDHIDLSAETLNSFRRLNQEVVGILKKENKDEGQTYTDEQKLEILSDSLYGLAQKINSSISISKNQIDAYVENRRNDLLDLFRQYRAAATLTDYLETSGKFKYTIGTSKDYEIPFSKQEHLSDQSSVDRFLDDLFSQSLYYVTENGSSLRLKLFEAKTKNMDAVVQQLMERIFYTDHMLDYIDKKVVKVESTDPNPHKYVFEIASPLFQNSLQSQEAITQPVKTEVAVIVDEEGIYVNVPDGSTLHSGWHIVNVKNLA